MNDSSSSTGRSLEERLGSFAEPWKPNAGDQIVGQVIDVDSRTTEFGTYPIVTLATDNGEIAVHAFHTVLKNEFGKRPPQLGERVGIKYHGKSPKGYEGYRIVFENAAPVDWNRIAVEAQAEHVLDQAAGESDASIPF